MAQMRPTCEVQQSRGRQENTTDKYSVRTNTHTALFKCGMYTKPSANPCLSFDTSAAYISATATTAKRNTTQKQDI